MINKIQNLKSKIQTWYGCAIIILNKNKCRIRHRRMRHTSLGFGILKFGFAKRGYTLIEVVAVIVVSGIVLYPLLSIIFNCVSKNPTIESFDQNLSLASSKLEEVCGRKFSKIVSEPQTSFGGDFSNSNYEVIVHYVASSELSTSVDPTKTDYKLIKVKVGGTELSGLAADI